jgi:hypothetical protein
MKTYASFAGKSEHCYMEEGAVFGYGKDGVRNADADDKKSGINDNINKQRNKSLKTSRVHCPTTP